MRVDLTEEEVEAFHYLLWHSSLPSNLPENLAVSLRLKLSDARNEFIVRKDATRKNRKILNARLEALPLPETTIGLLKKGGILTVKDLILPMKSTIQTIPGIGMLRFQEIEEILEPFGLRIGFRFEKYKKTTLRVISAHTT